MDRNFAIQYTVVGIILIAAIIWVCFKLFGKRKNKKACCGCALSGKCAPAEKRKGHSRKKECP